MTSIEFDLQNTGFQLISKTSHSVPPFPIVYEPVENFQNECHFLQLKPFNHSNHVELLRDTNRYKKK